MVIHTCEKCGKTFNHKTPYNYHVYDRKKSCVKEKSSETNKKNFNEKNYAKNGKFKVIFQCLECGKSFENNKSLKHHICSLKEDRSQLENNNEKLCDFYSEQKDNDHVNTEAK